MPEGVSVLFLRNVLHGQKYTNRQWEPRLAWEFSELDLLEPLGGIRRWGGLEISRNELEYAQNTAKETNNQSLPSLVYTTFHSPVREYNYTREKLCSSIQPHHISPEIIQPKAPAEDLRTAYNPILDSTLAQTTSSAQ